MENTTNTNTFLPRTAQVFEDNVLEKIEVDKNTFIRIIQSDDLYIDVRKFYKGFPTKQGIRFKVNIYKQVKDQIDKYIK